MRCGWHRKAAACMSKKARCLRAERREALLVGSAGLLLVLARSLSLCIRICRAAKALCAPAGGLMPEHGPPLLSKLWTPTRTNPRNKSIGRILALSFATRAHEIFGAPSHSEVTTTMKVTQGRTYLIGGGLVAGATSAGVGSAGSNFYMRICWFKLSL